MQYDKIDNYLAKARESKNKRINKTTQTEKQFKAFVKKYAKLEKKHREIELPDFLSDLKEDFQYEVVREYPMDYDKGKESHITTDASEIQLHVSGWGHIEMLVETCLGEELEGTIYKHVLIDSDDIDTFNWSFVQEMLGDIDGVFWTSERLSSLLKHNGGLYHELPLYSDNFKNIVGSARVQVEIVEHGRIEEPEEEFEVHTYYELPPMPETESDTARLLKFMLEMEKQREDMGRAQDE